MTKVIIISTVGLIYDGITNVLLSYLQAMDLEKFDVYIAATVRTEPGIRKKLEGLGCHIVDLPSRSENTARYFFRLIYFIRRNKIRVIHAHGNSGTLAVEMLAGWVGGCKKRIAHSHNTQCGQMKMDKLLRPVFNLFYTDALACSRAAGRWLFGKKKFMVLQNGRNIAWYAYDESIRKAVRDEYHLKKEFVFGHVGGFFEQKNHQFLLQIYKEILKREPDAWLFMVGDGPLKKEIERQVGSLGDNVVFTGATDRVVDYLQAMDAMLLPSFFEGLPLVAIEWQINGLPCILSDTVTRDCAFTETAVFMSLEDTAGKWAERVIQMARNADRRINAETAKQKAKNAGFDINDSACILEELYLQIKNHKKMG